MRFEKYHGQGNDFIIVQADNAEAVSPMQAMALCHRHFGVGADGVLVVSPSERAQARMTVLNADGSRPEMCGNGLRCVGHFLATRAGAPNTFDVETDAGLRHCQVIEHFADGVAESWIAISLGCGSFQGHFGLEWHGQRLDFDLVSMGNPHAVLFDSHFQEAQVDVLGPIVSSAQPRGANVEFVRLTAPNELQVIVWERGVGRTMACGTGAGAVVLAAARRDLVPFDVPVRVQLPGGTLEVTVERATMHVHKQGPVAHVFSGETQL